MPKLLEPQRAYLNEVLALLSSSPKLGIVLAKLAEADKPISSVELSLLVGTKVQDAAIRQDIKRLRAFLDNFYSRRGLAHTERIHIQNDHRHHDAYFIEFVPHAANLQRVWHPYLPGDHDPAPSVTLVYVEPLFYRIEERRFIRHQDVNEERAQLRDKYLPEVPRDIRGARNYVGSGDVDALLELTCFFERRGVATRHMVWQQWVSSWKQRENVILLGNARTFPRIPQLLERYKSEFLVTEHELSILTPNPADKTPADNRQGPFRDDLSFSRASGHVYGIVRRFIHENASVVTVFAANHSRFIEAAARALTDDAMITQLATELNQDAASMFQGSFELFGKAHVTEMEEYDRVLSLSWLAARCESAAGTTKTKTQA